jgi:hypothetical protein
MASTNHHFYEQSSSSWNREWADDGSDMEEMTDDEREEAERAARIEIKNADTEAADYRKQEREGFASSRFAKMDNVDMDAPF